MNIMVQIFKETLLTSLILFLMTARSDDKKELKIIVEPTSFHYEQTGGSKKFGITPNEPATFQSSEAWCKVTSESSTPVQAIYNITVEPNTTPDVRNAIITVSVKEHVQEINVEQAAYIQSDEPEKYTVRENLTTHQLINEMGLGINLGNTLDAVGDWIDPSNKHGEALLSHKKSLKDMPKRATHLCAYRSAGAICCPTTSKCILT